MKLEHIAMFVKDLEGAKDFFIKYFGADPNEGYHNEKTGFHSYFLICKHVLTFLMKNSKYCIISHFFQNILQCI